MDATEKANEWSAEGVLIRWDTPSDFGLGERALGDCIPDDLIGKRVRIVITELPESGGRDNERAD